MKSYVSEARTGKTTRLLEYAMKNGFSVMVANETRVRQALEAMEVLLVENPELVRVPIFAVNDRRINAPIVVDDVVDVLAAFTNKAIDSWSARGSIDIFADFPLLCAELMAKKYFIEDLAARVADDAWNNLFVNAVSVRPPEFKQEIIKSIAGYLNDQANFK